MTKVVIIGQTQGVEVEKKKIEFITCCAYGDDWFETNDEPKNCKFIELIAMDFAGDHRDLMFGHDGDRSCGVLYLGHFNDGVV